MEAKMNIQELQRAIEDYPQKYQRALSRRTKAEATIKQLEEELKLARSQPEEPDAEESVTPQGETYEQVQVRLEEKSAAIGRAVRSEPANYHLPKNPTGKAVDEVIDTDPEVKKLKEKLLGLRPQRGMARRIPNIRSLSPKAQEIQERLWKAELECDEAENEIEVCQAELETYKLLTTILTASLSSSGVTHHD